MGFANMKPEFLSKGLQKKGEILYGNCMLCEATTLLKHLGLNKVGTIKF